MKAKYGFKALARLAQARGQSLLIADIAEREGIPRKFLEHILVQLKPQGIVHSKKGRGSGYMLERDASKISVGDVIRILDGPLARPCRVRARPRIARATSASTKRPTAFGSCSRTRMKPRRASWTRRPLQISCAAMTARMPLR